MCLAQISQARPWTGAWSPRHVLRRWPRRAVVERSQSAGDPANFPIRTGLVRHGGDTEQETYIERVELEREMLSGGLHNRRFEERMSALPAGRRVHRHEFTSPMTS